MKMTIELAILLAELAGVGEWGFRAEKYLGKMCKIIPYSIYRELLWPSTILYMSKRLVETIQCKSEVAHSIIIDSPQTLHPEDPEYQ